MLTVNHSMTFCMRFYQEEDYVGLAAKHFYVQHGSDIGMENTKTVVKECINSKLLEAKSEDKWAQMVNTAHAQVEMILLHIMSKQLKTILKSQFVTSLCHSLLIQGPFINSRTKSDKVKAEVVDYARQKWPMFFSKFFEVAKLSGKHCILRCDYKH